MRRVHWILRVSLHLSFPQAGEVSKDRQLAITESQPFSPCQRTRYFTTKTQATQFSTRLHPLRLSGASFRLCMKTPICTSHTKVITKRSTPSCGLTAARHLCTVNAETRPHSHLVFCGSISTTHFLSKRRMGRGIISFRLRLDRFRKLGSFLVASF